MNVNLLAPRISEGQFQETVIQLAKLRGWLVMHTRPAWSEKGWRTPIEGDAGFPDLVLARHGKVIYAELKSEKGRVTAAQQKWMTALGDVHLWRPSDLDQIKEVLR